jgi:putative tricarboxylic transport membrane protein
VVDGASAIASAEAFVEALRATATRTGGYIPGSINQLVGMALGEQLGQRVEFVATASAVDLVPALRDGRLDWAIGTPVEVNAELKRGEIRALAVLAPTSLARFPEVPPLASTGVSVDIVPWRGLMGPPNLSTATQAAWNQLLGSIVSTTIWQRHLTDAPQTGALLSGMDFGALLEREDAWYQDQLGRAGLVPVA